MSRVLQVSSFLIHLQIELSMDDGVSSQREAEKNEKKCCLHQRVECERDLCFPLMRGCRILKAWTENLFVVCCVYDFNRVMSIVRHAGFTAQNFLPLRFKARTLSQARIFPFTHSLCLNIRWKIFMSAVNVSRIDIFFHQHNDARTLARWMKLCGNKPICLIRFYVLTSGRY